MTRLLLHLAFLLACFSQITYADTLSDAIAAKSRGDFKTAYPLWVKLAEEGDDKAAVEVGFMYHMGQAVPQDYDLAMDWYLKAFPENVDAINNIGIMHERGLGVPQNKKIAHLLFLIIHMESMGDQTAIIRANRNLNRTIAQLSLAERQESLCYTPQYVMAYVNSKGHLKGIPPQLRASAKQKRFKDLDWWLPGEIDKYQCPTNT